MSDANAAAIGLAGEAVATALIETLLDKNILTLTEVRSILERALRTIGPPTRTSESWSATQIIDGMVKGRFSAQE